MRDICRAHQTHPGYGTSPPIIAVLFFINADLEAKLFTHDLLGGRTVLECCRIPIESGGINFCQYVVIEG